MNAKLHIQASLRNGITYLNKSYFTPPFKIADITEDKKAGPLQLMMMCSSPGILDEDDYDIKIELDEGCNMQLHTQGYQRLFTMNKGAAQLMQVYLNKDASFTYLPHPSVPHEHSIFTAKNKIYLSDNCSLVWGEVLTCGRKLNGEVFKFSKYHNLTEVFINDKLVVKENLLMQPSVVDTKAIGQLEQFTHQASLICLNEKINVNELLDEVYEYLSLQNEIIFGVTAAPVNGMIVRLLGNKAEQLWECLISSAQLFKKRQEFQR